MIKTGLVSLSFNEMSILDICQLAVNGGVDGIEWSADRHLPVGELQLAERIGNVTRSRNLEVLAYGSPYQAGVGEGAGLSFESVLKTAQAVGAPRIRVWAGNMASNRASFALISDIQMDLKRIATLALRERIHIEVEVQPNTVADTPKSILNLVHAADHPNISILWKPCGVALPEVNRKNLIEILEYVRDFRTCYQRRGSRRPLSDGEHEWKDWLSLLKSGSREQYAMLEFFENDSPQQFLSDARVLQKWLYVTNKF